MGIDAAEIFAEKRIACITGKSATAIDRAAKTVRFSDGMSLPYEKLLLATGAVPRRLALAEQAGERIAYLRTFADALAHPRPSSCRDAMSRSSAAASSGSSWRPAPASAASAVTVIEAQPRILMRGVPEEIAEIVAARHLRRGRRPHLRYRADAQSPLRRDGVRIELSDGRTIDADLVVIGIGAIPSHAAGGGRRA